MKVKRARRIAVVLAINRRLRRNAFVTLNALQMYKHLAY